MFRSTFIKKISISWLSQHSSNNFTISSKFLFIYIFPSQIPQAFPLFNDHWKSSNTFKIFLSKRSIHYEIYKPKNSQFPYPQPYQLYHFTSISYISFLLSFLFSLSPKFIQFPDTSAPSRGEMFIILFHRPAIYPQNRGRTIPVSSGAKFQNQIDSRSVYNYGGNSSASPGLDFLDRRTDTYTRAHTPTSMIDSLSFAREEITANWGRSIGIDFSARSGARGGVEGTFAPGEVDQMIFRHLARCVYLSSLKRVSSSIRFARIIFTRLPVGLLLAFRAGPRGFRVSWNLEERKFLVWLKEKV